MASTKREHLIDTALDLFSRHGFHATGIDRILSESGVAKMTLYNHFKSKDELILAALRRRDEQFRNWFMRAVERRATGPRDRLLAMFDALEEWAGGKEFNGCMFINAAAEFCGGIDSVRNCCAEHKYLVLAYVRDLAAAAGADDPAALAERLSLLMEGVIVTSQIHGTRDAASHARGAALVLIDDALGGAGGR